MFLQCFHCFLFNVFLRLSVIVSNLLQKMIGQQNDVMLVRVCVVQDAMFPTSGIGLGLPKDAQGGYGLVSVTAFVTEPS